MYAERAILETDTSGHLKNAPALPPNSRIEAIFLVLQETCDEGERSGTRRHPHPDIAGKTAILGDIMASAPADDWDLPR